MTTDPQQLQPAAGAGGGESDEERAAREAREAEERAKAEAAAAAAGDGDGAKGRRRAKPPEILSGRPEDTNGVYIVLWARIVNPDELDEREQPVKPKFREVAYVKTDSPMRAKGALLESPDFAWLLEKAKERPGIWLYAVAAFYWPSDTEPTTFFQPPPELKIG